MDKGVLNNEAERIMDKFKTKMEKKDQKDYEKAKKKWIKKHPDKPIEDFTYGDIASSYSNIYMSDNSFTGGNINRSEILPNNTSDYR